MRTAIQNRLIRVKKPHREVGVIGDESVKVGFTQRMQRSKKQSDFYTLPTTTSGETLHDQ